MTDAIDNGGPAFPACHPNAPETHGMSLREWFAGQALVGIGQWLPPNRNGTIPNWSDRRGIADSRAAWAVEQADAMLRALEVGQ